MQRINDTLAKRALAAFKLDGPGPRSGRTPRARRGQAGAGGGRK